jgi:hypothetical protein
VNQKQGEAPSVQLLDDAEKFRNNLVQKTVDISSPPILGLKHEAHMVGDKRGFVVTYVPQSNDRPHMAMASEGRYFVRSGESAVKMGHHQVKDAFVAKALPDIRLFINKGLSYQKGNYGLQFEIRNVGVVSAENYRVEVIKSVNLLVDSFQRFEKVSRRDLKQYEECVCLYPVERLADISPSEILHFELYPASTNVNLVSLEISFVTSIFAKNYFQIFKVKLTNETINSLFGTTKNGFIECPAVSTYALKQYLEERIELPHTVI